MKAKNLPSKYTKVYSVPKKWKDPTRDAFHQFRIHTETKKLLLDVSRSELEDINQMLEQALWGIVPQLQQHQVAVNINYQHIEQHQQAVQSDVKALLQDLYAFFQRNPLPVYSEILKELEKEVLKKYGK